MPVDGEPVDDGVGDDVTDAIDGGEFVTTRGPDRVDRAEIPGERAGRDRPDVADAECDEDAPQLFRLGEFQL